MKVLAEELEVEEDVYIVKVNFAINFPNDLVQVVRT